MQQRIDSVIAFGADRSPRVPQTITRWNGPNDSGLASNGLTLAHLSTVWRQAPQQHGWSE